MTKKMKLGAWLIGVGVLSSGNAQAALIDRGSGMIYDTDLNITWLKDANYAKTSGYDADGRMNWSTANTWADTLFYGGYSDWRLPSTTDLGTAGCNYAFSGTNCGFNVTTNSSELAHLFFVELSNLSTYDSTGAYQFSVMNRGPFQNFQSDVYWSDAFALLPTSFAWDFNTAFGLQYVNEHYYEFYAWAVRPGDVAAIPEPGSALLIGLGLAGLAALRRHRALEPS